VGDPKTDNPDSLSARDGRAPAPVGPSTGIYLLFLAGELLAIVGVGTFARPHIERDFFVVASQILPVLLLAAIIDLRLLSGPRSSALGATLLVLSFAAGEIVALAITGNQKPVITSSWWLGVVVASLGSLAALIAAQAAGLGTRRPPG
jgi:hypothetical protein